MTNEGEHIDLTNMTDEEAKIAAEYFMLLGVPTFEGKAGK
jgi:hypothetical protein